MSSLLLYWLFDRFTGLLVWNVLSIDFLDFVLFYVLFSDMILLVVLWAFTFVLFGVRGGLLVCSYTMCLSRFWNYVLLSLELLSFYFIHFIGSDKFKSRWRFLSLQRGCLELYLVGSRVASLLFIFFLDVLLSIGFHAFITGLMVFYL